MTPLSRAIRTMSVAVNLGSDSAIAVAPFFFLASIAAGLVPHLARKSKPVVSRSSALRRLLVKRQSPVVSNICSRNFRIHRGCDKGSHEMETLGAKQSTPTARAELGFSKYPCWPGQQKGIKGDAKAISTRGYARVWMRHNPEIRVRRVFKSHRHRVE